MSDIISGLFSVGTFAYGIYLFLIGGASISGMELIKAGAAVVFGFIFSAIYLYPLTKTVYTKIDAYFKSLAEKIEKSREEKKNKKPVDVVVVETPEVVTPEVVQEEEEMKEDKIGASLDSLLVAFAGNDEAVSHIKALYTMHLDAKVKSILESAGKVEKVPNETPTT